MTDIHPFDCSCENCKEERRHRAYVPPTAEEIQRATEAAIGWKAND